MPTPTPVHHTKDKEADLTHSPSPLRRLIAAVLLQRQSRLWPRFLAIYTRFQQLPRHWWRRIYRAANEPLNRLRTIDANHVLHPSSFIP